MLHGDLAVVGSGDPTFSGRWSGDPYSAFHPWADALVARGIRRVDGDLLLVDGRFEGPGVHPDWPEDQRARWYQAPVSALNFSDNCMLLAIRPSVRGRPRVDLVPPLGHLLQVTNRTLGSTSRRRHRVRIVREGDSSAVEVDGMVYRGAQPVEAWVTVPDPPRYFGAALRDALGEDGVTIDGDLRPLERLPATGWWQQVAVHRSDLLTTLEVTNRRSQNLYAETLLKTVGAERCGEGSWAGGLRAVAAFLERLGIPPERYSMVDGSGLSRRDRFAPADLVRLLREMYDHRWGRELVRLAAGLRRPGAVARGPARPASLPRQRPRQDRHPLRGVVPVRLRQGAVRPDLRLLDPRQPDPERLAGPGRPGRDRPGDHRQRLTRSQPEA